MAHRTLVRTELMMAGWKAYVNAKPSPSDRRRRLPEREGAPGHLGRHYSFVPPHEKYAVLLALLAALFLISMWVYERRYLMRERLP